MQICCTHEICDSGTLLLTLGNDAYPLSTQHKTSQLTQPGINFIDMRIQKPVILLIKVNPYFKNIDKNTDETISTPHRIR